MARDYYAILGVARNATEDQIRSAYRKLARQHHPDVASHDGAADRFKEVTEAYEVLADPQKRQRYDMFGTGDGLGDFGVGDLFDQFFGGAMRRRERGPLRGADLRMELEIDLLDAVRGAERTVVVPRMETCERCGGEGAEPGSKTSSCATCGGRGEVRQVQQSVFGRFVNVSTCPRCGGVGKTVDKVCVQCRGEGRERREREVKLGVPAGIEDGVQIRVAGEGEAGMRGGPSGDLYVLIRQRDHPTFQRDGDDLVQALRVSPAQAVLGDLVTVRSIEDEEATVKIPAGAQHGDIVRLRGRGVPHYGRAGRGDQLIVVDVVIPRGVTKEERGLYEKLRAVSGPLTQDDEDRTVLGRIKDALGGE